MPRKWCSSGYVTHCLIFAPGFNLLPFLRKCPKILKVLWVLLSTPALKVATGLQTHLPVAVLPRVVVACRWLVAAARAARVLGFSPRPASARPRCSGSSGSLSAGVCKLCGYPKKNPGRGKKRNKFKMTRTKLYQKSWAHISCDDFSVCGLLQLLGFFLGETHPHTHTQRAIFTARALKVWL